MILYKNSLSSKFYCKFYNISSNRQTENFCDWAWAYIFAIISLPLTWITIFFSFHGVYGTFSKIFIRSILGFLMQSILTVFLVAMYQNICGTLIFVGGAIGLVVLVGCFFSLVDKYQNRKSKKENKIPIIKQMYISFKEKYCPKIEWR